MADSGNQLRNAPVLAPVDELTIARTAPDAIRSKSFTIVRKGFHPREVTAYLERLAGDVQVLHNRLRQIQPASAPPQPTRERIEAQVQRPAAEAQLQRPAAESEQAIDDVFIQAGSRIAGLMRMLEEDVRVVEQRARAQAQADMAAARAESDEIKIEARLAHEEATADAAAIVASARNDADAMLREAKTRADEIEARAKRILRDARSEADEILKGMSRDRTDALDDVRRLRTGLGAALARIEDVLDEHEEDREDADRVIVVDETPDDAHTQ